MTLPRCDFSVITTRSVSEDSDRESGAEISSLTLRVMMSCSEGDKNSQPRHVAPITNPFDEPEHCKDRRYNDRKYDPDAAIVGVEEP